jgi:ankyrin repeat protein
MGDFEKLIEAAQRGNVADVRAIVQSHAELINRRDQLGATALHHAAFGGHRGVVQVRSRQRHLPIARCSSQSFHLWRLP